MPDDPVDRYEVTQKIDKICCYSNGGKKKYAIFRVPTDDTKHRTIVVPMVKHLQGILQSMYYNI